MKQEILSACSSSSTAGHLGFAKTPEKRRKKILSARTTGRHQTVCQPVSGMSETFGTAERVPTVVGGMAS